MKNRAVFRTFHYVLKVFKISNAQFVNDLTQYLGARVLNYARIVNMRPQSPCSLSFFMKSEKIFFLGFDRPGIGYDPDW